MSTTRMTATQSHSLFPNLTLSRPPHCCNTDNKLKDASRLQSFTLIWTPACFLKREATGGTYYRHRSLLPSSRVQILPTPASVLLPDGVVIRGREKHLNLCSMWSLLVLDHRQSCFGGLNSNTPTRFLRIHTGAFFRSRTIRVQLLPP